MLNLGKAEEEPATLSRPEHAQQVFKFTTHLLHHLLAVIYIIFHIFTRQALARTADGKAVFIQQVADLAHHDHILALVIAAITTPFKGRELGELLLPITQYVRLYIA